MLISLGSLCKVREAIQRHLCLDRLESNLFDWIRSNFGTIVYFIQHIDEPIIESDLYDTNIVFMNNRLVFHNKIKFDIIHDCDAKQTYEEALPVLLEKYNRRLIRLKNNILNNTKIDFIHLVDCEDNSKLYIPTSQEIALFYEGIQKINPNCNVRLHILLPPPNCRFAKESDNKSFVFTPCEINKLANENTLIHYVDQDENVDTNGHVCTHWNWKKIFDSIEI